MRQHLTDSVCCLHNCVYVNIKLQTCHNLMLLYSGLYSKHRNIEEKTFSAKNLTIYNIYGEL